MIQEQPIHKFNNKVFESRTNCYHEHDLFVSFANFPNNSVTFNKGMTMVKIRKYTEHFDFDNNECSFASNDNVPTLIVDIEKAGLS